MLLLLLSKQVIKETQINAVDHDLGDGWRQILLDQQFDHRHRNWLPLGQQLPECCFDRCFIFLRRQVQDGQVVLVRCIWVL